VFSNHFDALILKIILKNKKYIILMFFQVKSTLKITATTLPILEFLFEFVLPGAFHC
jgi:hypothetical protein